MKFKKRFENKKIFVTGASRGIGKGIAQAFRSQGAWVIGTCTGSNTKTGDICNEWFYADFSDTEQIKNCSEFLQTF